MPFTILIVDDDRAFRSEIREILEEQYEVLEASTGEQALGLIKKPHLIDLVLLDIKMPGLQGTEVLKEIKKADSGIIIVMLTASDCKEFIIESLREHADDYLQKPLSINRALEVIRKLLEKKSRQVSGLMERIKYILEKNYQKNINLEEMAGLVCLSPKYISRIFKEQTGTGFIAYKQLLKINKAKELLSIQDFNINQISGKIGYLNVESFIRIFKRMTGLTPAAYRRRLLRGDYSTARYQEGSHG